MVEEQFTHIPPKIPVSDILLTLSILMDYRVHIDAISIESELSILYFKGLPVKIPIKLCISVPADCFILINSADPDEIMLMQYFIWVFTVCQSTVYPYPE